MTLRSAIRAYACSGIERGVDDPSSEKTVANQGRSFVAVATDPGRKPYKDPAEGRKVELRNNCQIGCARAGKRSLLASA